MHLRTLCPALAILTALAGTLAGAEEAGQPSQEYLQQKAELEELLTKRDLDLYELYVRPGRLGRVVLVDRLGRDRVYNYLTFSVRNQATMDQAQLATRAKGYNEVLQAMATQYEKARVEAEGGGKLRLDGIEGKDGVIVERTESQLKTRTVSLSVLASDEDGTRIRLLDEVPGTGPQEDFAFNDLGNPHSATVMQRVKEKVEEIEGRRLLTADELRHYPLPPFDGTTRVESPDITDPKHDMHGWFVGEAHVVIVFSKLSDFGDQFTIQINGLCNKMRFRGNAPEPGKPSNYFLSRTMRRTFVMRFDRPGDEFFRDLDRFDLVRSGYEWVDSFQRTEARRTSSYARYFLEGIADEKGLLNSTLYDQFWPYYDEQRAKFGKLPDVKPKPGN